MGLDRRTLLQAAAAGLPLLALGQVGVASAAAAGSGFAVLDWGLASTMQALGIKPVGVPAPDWCNRYAVEPVLAADVVDVGLLFAPNFELLQELAPSLIIMPPTLMMAAPMLQRIAPLCTIQLFRPGPDAIAVAEAATKSLTERIGNPTAAETLITGTRDAITQARTKVSTHPVSPVLIASPLDSQHVSIYGSNSLHGDVLKALGLENASKSIAGEFSIVSLESLGNYPDATVVLVESPVTPGITGRVATNRLWQTFPFVRENRLHVIGPVLGSGGLPAAGRLARLLADALGDRGSTAL